MEIADLVRTPDGRIVRITGFWRREDAPRGARPLPVATVDDDRLAAIQTYAVCGEFFRPWDLVRIGTEAWGAATTTQARAA